MMKLTARQTQILALIEQCIEETGYPPTRAEIAATLGFKSANAAEDHLRALEKKGAIEMVPGASRGIRLAAKHQGIPLIGRVAAGNPILAEENIEDYINVPHNLFHPEADYLLRVRGDSMKDAGILNNDLLAVKKTDTANNGDLVVARINDEVTVKTLAKQRQKYLIHLLPKNPDFDTIVVDLRETPFAIEGLGVGVIRISTQGR
ncbi:MAG: transcriptional repressor LexA [Porticoccaceae bacterium]|nr:transcriptional repressor LexA [Porticoccaceae bacterium]